MRSWNLAPVLDRASIEGLTVVGAELVVRNLKVASLRIETGTDLVLPEFATGAWSLAPLGAAQGRIEAQIKDAALVFDADVTVPIEHGRIDFNDATVEHVGPDSRMGVSKMGVYVDAPNGRSYAYQFPAAPVAGVAFERRGALLGTRVSDRGKLMLQPFVEALLAQGASGPGAGFTEQGRQLLERTAVAGFVQLGDGEVAAPGVRAEFAGRASGRNLVRVHSPAASHGFTLEIAALSLRSVECAGAVCSEVTGSVKLESIADGAKPRLLLEVSDLQVAQLRLPLPQAA